MITQGFSSTKSGITFFKLAQQTLPNLPSCQGSCMIDLKLIETAHGNF